MAIFAKEAYRSDVSVMTLLALRFALAAAVFWAIVAVRRPLPALPERRLVPAALGLGALGYAVQSGTFFAALTRIDASLDALLLYVYPALVFAAAVALRRESADRRRLAALGLATGGAALSTVGLGAGSIALHFDPAGWAWIAALSLVGTVGAASAFLIGLPKVGPATASIVSTVEPVVTVSLAMLLFGERLGRVQLAGGAAVLAAVVLLQAKVQRHVAPPEAAAPAPARPLASEPARG
jgi:drug/metabolite transporter (DMT)-like permease